jgi:hypothetical protein
MDKDQFVMYMFIACVIMLAVALGLKSMGVVT